jgi:Ca2+-transporting ATPase
VADVVTVLLLGVSLAVAAVPEGLPAILSVVLAMGVQRMARHHAIVKKLASVETLGSASVIATDKTGTLTRGEMTIVQRVMTRRAQRHHRRGLRARGRRSSRRGELPAGPVLRASCRPCCAAAAWPATPICARTTPAPGRSRATRPRPRSWSPNASSARVTRRSRGPRPAGGFERIGEIPFTSQRKMMSVLEVDHDHGDAHVLITKGAPDVLLARCTHARRGKATVALDAALRQQVLADVDTR